MVKIFADGADLSSILELNNNPLIHGFTTNPTILKQNGIKKYESFAKKVLKKVKYKPVSFEVISDDFQEMFSQALKINSWGKNVYVKIPITNSQGKSSYKLIEKLVLIGVKVNVTAITTISQLQSVLPALYKNESYVSIFAGRIADTGSDYIKIMKDAIESINIFSYTEHKVKLIWASPREVYNIYQADNIGCDIITCTPDLIKKYETLKGKDLTEYSRETVQMFYDDAIKSGLKL